MQTSLHDDVPATPAVLLISDLHLQASHPATMQAFTEFMQTHARSAKSVYLLGDIFEAWPGDDDLSDPFNANVAAQIRAVSDAGIPVFWMAGNRDFLVGERFAAEAGVTRLSDVEVMTVGDAKIALVHGDAECTDDVKYMAFRQQVRNPAWQQQFLALPLAQRKAIAASARKESSAEQSGKSYEIMDVNRNAIDALFRETGGDVLIHGHTHRPALHRLTVDDRARSRYVLPDWDLEAQPPRGGWIAIDEAGNITRHRLDSTLVTD